MNNCDTLVAGNGKVKHNHLVHAITNRQGPFNTSIPTSDWFIGEEQKDYWNYLREGLFLDKRETDYYIYLALTILLTHEDIASLCADTKLTFNLGNIEVLRSTFTDGGFTTVGRNLGKFKNYTDLYPIPSKFSIKYKNTKQLLVTTDVGREYVAAYTKSKRGDDSVLLVDWNERLPIKGPMLFQGDWDPTACIDINYVPYGINYKQWLSYIEAKMDILEVLNASGIAGIYFSSQSETEKLALLIASLAILNTSVNNK